MGRIRCIKPELPLSESLSRVSRDARLLFTYLFTLADDDGRLRGNTLMLARSLYPYDAEPDLPQLVDGWLTELEIRAKCIVRYDAGGDRYIAILDFRESATIRPVRPEWAQRPDHPYASKLPPPPVASVHEESRTSTAATGNTAPAREHSRMVGSAPETSPREDSRTVSNSRENAADDKTAVVREHSRIRDLDLDLRPDHRPDSRSLAKERERPGASEVFDRFWEKRPGRGGEPDPRAAAKREFEAAVRKGADPEVIEAGLLRYFAANADKGGTRFMPRTDKLLRDQVWEDYPAPKLAVVPERPANEPTAAAAPEDERWTRVRAALRAKLGDAVFASWFAPIEFAALGHGTVLLVAPTRFGKSWLASHYGDTLLSLWRAEDPAVQRVSVLARGIDPIKLPEPADAGEPVAPAAANPAEPAKPAIQPPTAKAPAGETRTPDELARDAVESEGITQVVGYGRTKQQAVALVGRWMATAGPKPLATLLAEAKTRELKGAQAIQWIEQQVRALKGQTVLPHTMPPVDVAKTARPNRPAPLVVPKRNASKRR